MAVPKRKTSKRRRDQRSAGKGLRPTAFTKCSNCTEPLATHVACANCGMYKGVKVLRTKAERSDKRSNERAVKQQKTQERQAKAQETNKE